MTEKTNQMNYFSLAGTPKTFVFFFTFLVTTEPAPTITLSSINIFGNIVDPEPIKTLFPTFTFPSNLTPGQNVLKSPISQS